MLSGDVLRLLLSKWKQSRGSVIREQDHIECVQHKGGCGTTMPWRDDRSEGILTSRLVILGQLINKTKQNKKSIA